MFLKHLSLTDFRAFSRLDMDVPRRILLLLGANAQGKTSLLEAVYFLSTFTSFHTQSDRQLVNFTIENEPIAVARLVAEFERGDHQHRMEVRLIQENNGNGNSRMRKEIFVDGVRRSVHEALGQFNAVIFLPRMMSILEGGPEERRRYLNLTISQAVPGYFQVLSEYNQVILQRNALLKQLAERGGDPGQLLYWDELLAQKGAQIIYNRISSIAELEHQATRIHSHLTGYSEILRLSYQPGYDPLSKPNGQFVLPIETPIQRTGIRLEDIAQGFLQRLLTLRKEEISRGVTTIGPHRDELRILGNGIDLGCYGSRGQTRTALLSLKLAEVNWLKEKTGDWPVLLLDEFLAELDVRRRQDLLAYLGECEQALLTTTDLRFFDEKFIDSTTVWLVERGRVCLPPQA